jgi:hypothetical protein
MPYLIGTDEAGFGPNLGPLTVSATVWELPAGVASDELYRVLGDVIVRGPAEVAKNDHACVAMTDSKGLFKPKAKAGLRHLERGLLAALAVLDLHVSSWQGIWETLAPDSAEARRAIPWYADYDTRVPIDADPTEIPVLAEALGTGLRDAGVRLAAVRSRAVFPEEFNRLVSEHDSKGAALSHITLGLAAELIHAVGPADVSVVCDKHGGRNRYADLLADHFPDTFIQIHGEDRELSVYRFGSSGDRVEFRFQTKAEQYLPVALASMASKYLRELAMGAFNQFWCNRVDGLLPTAGYPQDAKRFREEIGEVQAELGIEDRILWRER